MPVLVDRIGQQLVAINSLIFFRVSLEFSTRPILEPLSGVFDVQLLEQPPTCRAVLCAPDITLDPTRMAIALPTSPIQGLRTVELTSEHEEQLQAFFEANPQYFLAVNGEPAGPAEAHEEIHGELPGGWSFTKKWLVGYVNSGNTIVAMANVISDLLASSVWHIGLFMVATKRQGSGDAQALYQDLESWASANGANWLRLGVVQGNSRAERFWESLGYIQTRTRGGVEMEKLTNTLRVMVKPLASGTVEQYLALVERDRPEPRSGI